MPHDEPNGLTDWRSRPGRRLAGAVVRASGSSVDPGARTAAPYAVLLITALVGLIAATGLTLASAQIYDNVTDHNGLAGFDRPVLDQMIAWRTPVRNSWVSHFTDLGGTRIMPVIALVAAVLIAWWWRRWTPILLTVIAAGGSLVMTVVGKNVVDRARPAHSLAVPPYESSPSFPSGHSLNAWVVAGLVAYLVACRVGTNLVRIATAVVALSFAVAVGLSRVYLGHHWLTDVLVAWTIGTAWLIVVITGHRLALTVVRSRVRPDAGSLEGV